MVQKQTRRKSSLIMGAMLALLLGVAAGFFVLAMPTHLLEAVTTFTRLSKLMTQAEPPIMPYDKTVLAVLAGTLTAGIGWIAIDWLLFGRAGMRTLIREREDDYEDSEGDAFRPTDPLDLVAPVTLPTGDWAAPAAGDPRRPLSARTDIGDPPGSMPPSGLQPAAMPGIDQLLPPIDQLLPGAAAATPFPAVPPIQPAPPPDPFQPFGTQPQVSSIFGGPPMPAAEPPATPAWPGTDAPQPEPGPQSAAPTRAWLPTPGVRPDGSTPQFDLPPSLSDMDDNDDALDLTPSQATADPFGRTPPPILLNTQAPPPLFPATPPPLDIAPAPAPAPAAPAVPPFQPAAPPPLTFEPPAPPVTQPPVFEAPVAPPPFAQQPVFEPPLPPLAPAPAFEPAPPPAMQPPAFEAPVPPVVQPPWPPVVAAEPAPPRPASTGKIAGIDKDRLEDLLLRLEKGLEARRAAAARAAAGPPRGPVPVAMPQAPAAAPPPQPFAAPQPPLAEPEPPFAAQRQPFASPQPAAPVAPPASEPPSNFTPARPVMPPAGFAAPLPPMSQPAMSQPVAPTTAPVYDLPTMPVSPAYNLAPIQPAAPEPFAPELPVGPDEPASDTLLDQPLHVTLDLLRNKVRR